ncbi:MAG: glycosyltransferase family 9 protein, partial [Nitrospinota bacterium]
DVFYSLRGDFIGILLSTFFKIPVRIGFDNGGGGFLLTRPITPVENIHQIEQFLYAVGGNDSVFDKRMRLPLSDKEREFADTLIRQYSIKSPLSPFGKGGGTPKRSLGRGIFVGFHIGAGYPSKLWAPEKYGVLIKRLYDDFDVRAILIGGEEDREIIAETENIIKDTGAINLAGRTNIKETAAIIERCSLFIGNDSAPVHIAAAVGTPVIVIFSAVNNPVQWKPFGDNVICITKDISCHFCEKFECEDAKCMHMITVEEVYDKVKEVLLKTKEQRLNRTQMTRITRIYTDNFKITP